MTDNIASLQQRQGALTTPSSNLNPNTNRMALGPKSLPSLNTFGGLIYEEIRRELRFPQSSKIYKQMSLDSNVASAISLIEAIISSVKWNVVAPEDAPQSDKDAAEKLDYNLLVMDRPFGEYIGEMLSYLIYGFHCPEKVYTKHKDLPVGSFTGWKDFRTISQDTVFKWLFNTKSGDLSGLEQDIGRLVQGHIPNNITKEGSKVEIPRKKFMLFRFNPKRNNPEGVSPLRSNYITWKYRSVIEEFETIYATKGLGGVLDLGIDVAYLSQAAADPTSDAASVVESLKTSAANFHNGDQSYTITPLAYDEKGKPLFHTKILETTPPNTNDIIKRHDHRILMTFFADVLSIGADGTGSFALSDNKFSLLKAGIKQHLNNILQTLNHDLVRQTYELNKWDYDARTAARFVHDDIDDEELEAFAGAVQKIFAVEALDRTEDIGDAIRDKVFGLPPKAEASTEIRDTPEPKSRSGDGMSSGLGNGTGDSTSSGGDRATGNASGNTT